MGLRIWQESRKKDRKHICYFQIFLVESGVNKMNFISGTVPPEKIEGALGFAFSNDDLLIKTEIKGHVIPTLEEIEGQGIVPLRKFYMGTVDGKPCFCMELSDETPELKGMEYIGLRDVFHVAGEEMFRLAGIAIQIINWDKNHSFCGQCGEPTEPVKNLRAKRCAKCGELYFPRLSPAIIVAVVREGKILLARNRNFKRPIYSVIAGFVEAGESLEDTVVREVREEVGLEVKNIKYFGSQPWPFPNSLMMGFTAEYAGGEIRVDGEEILEAGWFSPEALPMLPDKASIARKLIDWFYEKYKKIEA